MRSRPKPAEPTSDPFNGWADDAAHWLKIAQRRTQGASLPSWTMGKGRNPQRLTAEDIAIGLWAVSRVGETDWGLSYQRLAKAFQAATGKPCHRAKASALLQALQTLGLIVKTAYEKRGKAGAKYAVVPETDTDNFNGLPISLAKPKAVGPRPKPIPSPAPSVETHADDASPFDAADDGDDGDELPPDPFNISRDGSNIKDD